MKTTLEINDELLTGAKQLAKRSGRPLRAVVEDGLRHVLRESNCRKGYMMPDCSVGDPSAEDPLEKLSWQDLRDEIYGKAGAER